MLEFPNADKLLAGPLGHWLQEQETVREEAKRQAGDRLFKAALAGVFALAILWILLPIPMDFKVFLTFGIGAAGWWWSQAPKRAAVKQVKTGINEAIAEALDLKYVHDLEPGQGFENAKEFKMLPHHHRASFEDMWSGHTRGHPFVLHEAKLEERRGSGKNKRWVTVFRGSILTIGFRRDFHGTTLVSRSGSHSKFFGGAKDSVELGGHHLSYVDMVHPGFEDMFDIYSNDQVEARYLVHPQYVERLIAVEQAFSGDDISTLFTGGNLVIVLNCGNLFESGSIEARDDARLVAVTIDQFARLAELADTLNEPERTGLS